MSMDSVARADLMTVRDRKWWARMWWAALGGDPEARRAVTPEWWQCAKADPHDPTYRVPLTRAEVRQLWRLNRPDPDKRQEQRAAVARHRRRLAATREILA